MSKKYYFGAAIFFDCFRQQVLKIAQSSKEAALRKVLDDVLPDKNAFGREYQGGDKVEGDEEYYPYASVQFQPQTVAV